MYHTSKIDFVKEIKTSTKEAARAINAFLHLECLGQNRSASRKKGHIKYDPQLLCLLLRFLIPLHEIYTYFRRTVSWITPNPVFNGFCSDKKTQKYLSSTKILPENKLKEFWPFSYDIWTARNTNFTNTEKGHKEPFQLCLFWKETCFKIKHNHGLRTRKMGKMTQAAPGLCSSSHGIWGQLWISTAFSAPLPLHLPRGIWNAATKLRCNRQI